jgi:hypothetical protein
VLDGSLIVIGGVVKLEPESTVDGDILVFGGNVTVEGGVRKNLVAVGGVVVLTENAEVFGDLIAPATVVRRDEGAQVYGQIIADTEGLDIQMPEIEDLPDIPDVTDVPEPTFFERYFTSVNAVLRPVTTFVWALVRASALAAVAVLVLLFLPKQTERLSSVVQEHPVPAGGLGILTSILAAPIMAVTAITIILIPATILIGIGLVLGGFFGSVAVGSEIGRRISDGFGYSWKRPLQTAAGTFAMAFLISILEMASWHWLSTILIIVVAGIGLGSVMMTRFGTREYLPTSNGAPAEEVVDAAPAETEEAAEPAEEADAGETAEAE